MSLTATKAAWNTAGLTSSQKLVLLAIADHADTGGTSVHSSQNRLAALTGLSVRQVRRILGQLDEMDLLDRGQNDRPGYRRSQVFHINYGNCNTLEMAPQDINAQGPRKSIADTTMSGNSEPPKATQAPIPDTHVPRPQKTTDTHVPYSPPIPDTGDRNKSQYRTPVTTHRTPVTEIADIGVPSIFNEPISILKRADTEEGGRSGPNRAPAEPIRGGGPKQVGAHLPSGYRKGIAEIRAALAGKGKP